MAASILLTHRFYWPDTAPYALMLRSLGEHFEAEGFNVKVFSSVPSYRAVPDSENQTQMPNSPEVKRIWVFSNEKQNVLKRLFNAIWYCSRLFLHILLVRPDVVVASTFPPVLAAWMASIAARLVGTKFVYHLQDIHPEISEISGGFLGKPIPSRFLRWLDNQTLKRSAAIVVLSSDMASTLQSRDINPLPICVINNMALTAFDNVSDNPPVQYRKPVGNKRIVYAGNMGRFQNLEPIVEGISQVLDKFPNLDLLLLGDGVLLSTLKARWEGNPQVVFCPFLPYPVAKQLISESDIGLVSLSTGICKVAFPSKIVSYLDLGVPVLAVVEPDSFLARDLTDRNFGRVPANSTPSEVAATLEQMFEHPPIIAGRMFSDTRAIYNNWSDLISSLTSTSAEL